MLCRFAPIVLLSAGFCAAAAEPPGQQPAPSASSLVNQQLPQWIRLSGELRFREEGFFGNRFTDGNDDMFLLQRTRLGVQLQPLPWLQMFAQGQDSRVWFTDRISPAPPYQDSADLRQAWVQIGRGEKSAATLRAGRQELAFGEERLVGASNWGNVARTFDAVRLGLRHRGYRADVFASSVVVPRDHMFDRHTQGDNLHGVYGGIENLIPRAVIEPYAFWHVMPAALPEVGAPGHLDSRTVGFRWNGTLPQAFAYTAEMAMQRGSWAADSVAAWAGFWRLGRSFNSIRWQPRARLEVNHASGDANPADGRHGTFDVLYPTPHDKYGMTDQAGWKNINHIGVTGEFRPHRAWLFQVKAHDRWLASARDGLYNAGGALLVRDLTGRAGTHVGEEVDVEAIWAPSPNLQAGGGVGHMFAGEFLKQTTPGHAYTFPYVSVLYGF